MVSEVDIISLNVDLARLLGIKLAHFNEIENALFSALDFDIGVSEQKFKAKFDLIDKLCGDLWSSDSAKIAELERFSITRIPETGETDETPETQSNSFMTFPFLKEENETEQDNSDSDENKITSKSRWAGQKVKDQTKIDKKQSPTAFDEYMSAGDDSSFDEEKHNDRDVAAELLKTTQKFDQGACASTEVI